MGFWEILVLIAVFTKKWSPFKGLIIWIGGYLSLVIIFLLFLLIGGYIKNERLYNKNIEIFNKIISTKNKYLVEIYSNSFKFEKDEYYMNQIDILKDIAENGNLSYTYYIDSISGNFGIMSLGEEEYQTNKRSLITSMKYYNRYKTDTIFRNLALSLIKSEYGYTSLDDSIKQVYQTYKDSLSNNLNINDLNFECQDEIKVVRVLDLSDINEGECFKTPFRDDIFVKYTGAVSKFKF